MSVDQPIVFILHGDDELAMARFVSGLHERLGAPDMADLNTTRLDGRQATEEHLDSAVRAMPFLTSSRLVVVTHPLARMASSAARTRFLHLLDIVPETTFLVLWIEDEIKKGQWETISEKHWLSKWVKDAKGRGVIKAMPLPRVTDMPGWIVREATARGGKFTPQAAQQLASFVGNDLQCALLEIEKILTYVDYKRPVEVDDVKEVGIAGEHTSIFDLVDRVATGKSREAVHILHSLLEEQEAVSIFAMIIRQFRLIIQAREALDEKIPPPSIPAEMGVHPFVAEKAISQAQRFSMPVLENIYHRFLEMDEVMKSSQIPADVVLDMFIAELDSNLHRR